MPSQSDQSQPELNLAEQNQSGAQLSLTLEPELRLMHLTINKDGKLMAGMVLSAEQMDNAIAGMMQVRSRMLPERPTQFSAGAAHEIKGTHYDFGIDGNSQELVFSLRDQALGWLSLRFGARLLERMLKVARTAQKPSAPGKPTNQ